MVAAGRVAKPAPQHCNRSTHKFLLNVHYSTEKIISYRVGDDRGCLKDTLRLQVGKLRVRCLYWHTFTITVFKRLAFIMYKE